ncbi:MAG: cytochrome c oxidase assembly protein [Actinomycetota bacterium]
MIPFRAHLDVVLVLAAVEAAYVVGVRRVGARYVEPGEPPASRRQVMLFSAGVGVLFIGSFWPIHDLAERYLFSFHMVQHMLFTLVAPPLLLLGIPGWLARLLVRPLMPVARMVLRPIPAFLLYNAVLVATHWPPVVELSVGSQPAHFVLHVVLVGSGLVMWWPVLSPLAEIPRLSYPGQMLYLFGQSIIPTVPASFLTFGDHPLYHVYEAFPRLWGVSAHTDQLVAGLLMKIGGGLILWAAIAVVFFTWFGREGADRPEEADWQRLERDLNRAGREP